MLPRLQGTSGFPCVKLSDVVKVETRAAQYPALRQPLDFMSGPSQGVPFTAVFYFPSLLFDASPASADFAALRDLLSDAHAELWRLKNALLSICQSGDSVVFGIL